MNRRAKLVRARLVASTLALCCLGWSLAAVCFSMDEILPVNLRSLAIRRIKVPANRPEIWPKGDWQPIRLDDLERQLQAADAARTRPGPYIEHAEYSARFADGHLHDGAFAWSIRRPEPASRVLSLGGMNLNLSDLAWSHAPGQSPPRTVPCGITPQGTSALLVERPNCQLDGRWNLAGRRLAASTDFDLQLPLATTSRLRIKVPAGMIVRSAAGEATRLKSASEAGWTEWQVWFGSRTSTRLTISPAEDAAAARPLNVARSNLSYRVRSDAVRVFAEFDLEVLESSLRHVRLLTDPDLQVTSIEYGDGGVVSWRQLPSEQGPAIDIQLPEQISGTGATLQVQAIVQIKQFGPWGLPRIRLQDFIETDSKVTVRLPPPFTVADIRADGFRQLSLTTDAEGESLLYRQIQPGATITIVPAETKPELACRTITLLQPDPILWSVTTQFEWSAPAGGAYAVGCRVPPQWEIVDTRSVDPAHEAEITGTEIENADSGQRILRVFFNSALNAERPQKFQVMARRLAPLAGEPILVPVFVPLDTGELEQFTIVSVGPNFRPVVDSGPSPERIGARALPIEIRNLDFLASSLSDRDANLLVLRTVGGIDQFRLRIDDVKSQNIVPPAPGAALSGGNPSSLEPSPMNSRETAGSGLVSLELSTRLSSTNSGFDEYRAEIHTAGNRTAGPVRFQLAAPAELLAVSTNGRRLATIAEQQTYAVVVPRPEAASGTASHVITIEYRVPARLRTGPNPRGLIFPVPTGEVVRFDLSIVVPGHLRLTETSASLPLLGEASHLSWWRRLLGPFARPEGEPLFNPLDRASWARLDGSDSQPDTGTQSVKTFRLSIAALPDNPRIVLWQESEVTSWTIAAFALFGLAGILVRKQRLRGLGPTSTLAFAGCTLTACVGSAVVSEIAAGAVVGLVLSALLPRRFLEGASDRFAQGEPQTVGSTQSFIPVGILLVAIGLGWQLSILPAQDGRSPTPGKSASSLPAQRPLFDVLIPVDASGKPVGSHPVAYIQRELADYLRQSAAIEATPEYLIGACQFDGRLDAADRLSIRASLEIHVLADAQVVSVTLPLGNVNLGGNDACLVDGQPHPVLATANGRGLVLELQSPAPVPEPPQLPVEDAGSDGNSAANPRPSTRPAYPPRTHRVELQLQPPSDAGRNDVSTSLVTIPATFRTAASIVAANKLPVLGILPGEANRRTGPIESTASNRLVLQPNPTRQLVYYWSKTAVSDAPPATVAQADVSCLADLHPGFMQLKYHVAYRGQSMQLDSLAWFVPAGHVLQTIQAQHLSSYRFRQLPGGGREMLIEFSRTLAEDFSLTATFVSRNDGFADPIAMPLVDPLKFEDTTTRKITLRSHQLALRQPSDVQVTISAAESGQAVKQRSVDQFLKEWNPAGARPLQAFDLDRTFVLKMLVEPKTFSPAVRGSSVGRIHSDHIDWKYTAEIEASGVPRFVYRLQVDRRLRVRHVSVREDGADRLLRWSQVRDSLIVFLNDRATRTQTVRVEASLPVSAMQEIEVPRVRLEGAVPGPETMVLFRDPNVSVRLANPEDFPLPSGNPPDAAGTAEQLVVRLDALPEQSNPRIVVERLPPRISAEVFTVLTPNAGTWQSTTAIAFQVETGSVTEFAAELPAELAKVLEISTRPPARTAQSPAAEGRVKLLIQTDEPVKKRLIAILKSQPDLSAGIFKLPDIRPEEAQTIVSRLAIPVGSFEPVDSEVKPSRAAWPDWLEDIVPSSQIPAWQTYSWTGSVLPAEFRVSRRDVAAEIEMARLELWLDHDGRVHGTLGLKISGDWPQSVNFHWPESCRMVFLSVGGENQVSPDRTPHDSSLAMPLPRDAQDRVIWLAWEEQMQHNPLLSEAFAPQLPWPVRLPVQRCLVNLHASAPFQFDIAGSPNLAGNAPLDDELPAPPWRANATHAAATGTGLWIEPPLPPAGTPLNLGATVRVMNNRSRQWVFALGLAAFAGLVGRLSRQFREWLTARELLAWSCLGLLWWLCFTPSWGVLVIVAWIGVRALLNRIRPQFTRSAPVAVPR